MPFEAEQHNFLDAPTRLFSMTAWRAGIPAVGLHAFEDGAATMRVKLLGVVTVVDAGGADFTRTETVTVFNDMCLLAPATLLAPDIQWRPRSATEVDATFRGITATLVFSAEGDLVDFWSDDRPALAPDNRTFVPMRWSTPVKKWRTADGQRVASEAEARYAGPTADYAYGEFELQALAVNRP